LGVNRAVKLIKVELGELNLYQLFFYFTSRGGSIGGVRACHSNIAVVSNGGHSNAAADANSCRSNAVVVWSCGRSIPVVGAICGHSQPAVCVILYRFPTADDAPARRSPTVCSHLEQVQRFDLQTRRQMQKPSRLAADKFDNA
jgi:hypothetical protein